MENKAQEDHPHADLTRQILDAAFRVCNALGCGFLEKVYENALSVQLKNQGLTVTQQVPIRVQYLGQTVGEYCADMIVQGAVLVETKATQKDDPIHVAQVLNYLRATKLPVGMLLNFGKPRLSYRRLVWRGNMPTCSEPEDC